MLRWRVGINILKPIPYHRPTVYRAPSWSWASVDGNISLIHVSDGISRAEFINCDMEPLSVNDHFLKVKKGTLVLRGPLKQATGLRWLNADSDLVELYDQDDALKVGSAWLDVGSEYPEEDVRIAWLAAGLGVCRFVLI